MPKTQRRPTAPDDFALGNKHLHVTQLTMLLRCPAQFEFRYVKGFKKPPGGALVRGGAYHGGLARNFRQKERTGKDLPVGDVMDAFDTEWKTRIEGAGEVEWGKDKPEDLKDQGYRVTNEYMRNVAPLMQPIKEGTERPIVAKVSGTDWRVQGTIDLVEERRGLADHKTSTAKWGDGRADNEIQASAYPALWQAATGDLLPFAFHVAVARKKDQEIQQVQARVDAAKIAWFRFMLLPRAIAMLEAGVFPPNPTGWWCSQKWCGYWDICAGAQTPATFAP